MIIILGLLALVISIVVLTIKYIRINSRILSRTSFRNAAEKRAARLTYEDPVITCDYCGAKVDTSADKVCPNCGADYSRDPEWLKRHAADLQWAEENASECLDEKLQEARQAVARTAARLKRALLLLTGITAAFLALGIWLTWFNGGKDYMKDEELNRYSFEDYIQMERHFPEEPVIFSECGVTLRITGLYRNQAAYAEGDYKLEYQLENNSGGPICVRFLRVSVNHRAGSRQQNFFYDWFRKGDTVTFYDHLYDTGFPDLYDLSYSDIGLYDDTDYIYEDTDTVRTLYTDAGDLPAPELPAGAVLFCEKGVTVTAERDPEEDEYTIYIMNDTDIDYQLESSSLRLNDVPIETSRIYGETIPAGHLYCSASIYGYDAAYSQRDPAAPLSLSFSFTSALHPAADFSTDYLVLPQ